MKTCLSLLLLFALSMPVLAQSEGGDPPGDQSGGSDGGSGDTEVSAHRYLFWQVEYIMNGNVFWVFHDEQEYLSKGGLQVYSFIGLYSHCLQLCDYNLAMGYMTVEDWWMIRWEILDAGSYWIWFVGPDAYGPQISQIMTFQQDPDNPENTQCDPTDQDQIDCGRFMVEQFMSLHLTAVELHEMQYTIYPYGNYNP